MKDSILKRHGSKVVCSALAVFSVGSFAALPAGIAAAITSVETDASSMADLIWPAVIAIAGSILLFKLFKRYFSKI